ncbi:hypothetical protein HHI36_019035 [Cryptolaemus montrouzieri]|uniref:RRM domain-containing protein n=1 Tax=Cryptolaemus montrouzieri TaxID=559131 RepID=A0ABD2P2T1_9CUCU
MFDEFLEVHANEAKVVKSLLLKSNKAQETDEHIEETCEQNVEEIRLANQQISDLDYMKQLMKKSGEPRQKQEKKVKEKIDFFTVKLKGLPYNCKKKNIKVFFNPLKPQSIRVPPKIHGIAYVGFKDEKKFKKALLKDKSFISGHQISVMKYDIQNKTSEVKVEDPHKKRWISQEDALKNEEEIAESGRIFLRNLAYTTTEDDLRPLFEKYGPLTELNLPIDSTSRKMKGFGTLTYLMPEHAVKAYSELDGSIFQGRMLHLLPAKEKDTANNNNNSEESSNYKQKKAAKQKSQSSMSHNWNALFLGHDAVAEVVADSFGTTKEAVIGPDNKGSAAVRLALGETQIVTQTRKYLEQEGVVLDVFTTPNSKRSKTVILVKNLPSKTNLREIIDIFEKHGVLGRVILPPSGITAIVEFVEAAEARKAFTKLAYSKFKNMPLYLEWAPENSLKEASPQTRTVVKEDSNEEIKKENEVVGVEEDSEDEEPEEDTTLFVKNLNFKTTDEALKKHFENCGKIHYATVATKKDKNNPGSILSMGYGFVRFKTKAATDKALKTLQQSVLDGKSLELKRSERTLQTDVESQKKSVKKSKQNGTKILVRNVPFQAKDKEIQELFSVFGEIKALRMPKKVSGDTHRGFAFVDYVTTSDAKEAFEALCQSTHLYGRRLVLEWAEQEGDEKTGKRSAEHFQKDDTKKLKKSKKNDGNSKTFTNLLDAKPMKIQMNKNWSVYCMSANDASSAKRSRKDYSSIKEGEESLQNVQVLSAKKRRKYEPNLSSPVQTRDLTDKVMKEISIN